MEQKTTNKYFPIVGDSSGLAQTEGLYKEELQLALRNRGMPLEALRYPITPSFVAVVFRAAVVYCKRGGGEIDCLS
jgi:hypothetical protein